MAGGINAWNGFVAEGQYDAGMAYFSGASGADELIALSWGLEEGNRSFYDRVSAGTREEETAAVFRTLCAAEGRHKETLRRLYAQVAGTDADPVPPKGMEAGRYLEGGSSVEEALVWSAGKPAAEILELAVAMETSSLDRYLKMARAAADPRAAEVFRTLSDEEKAHLERMAALLERLRGPA